MDPYIGEIKAFPYNSNFYPDGWLPCNGQIYQIAQYQLLYAMLGNKYGGDFNQHTFGVPNFQGCIPIGAGQGPGLPIYNLNQHGGITQVTLAGSQMPAHLHDFNVASTTAPAADALTVPTQASTLGRPYAKVNAQANSGTYGGDFSPIGLQGNGVLNPDALGPYPGGGGMHENRMPYVAMNYFIASFGYWPTPN